MSLRSLLKEEVLEMRARDQAEHEPCEAVSTNRFGNLMTPQGVGPSGTCLHRGNGMAVRLEERAGEGWN
jgi:hypothetical protein